MGHWFPIPLPVSLEWKAVQEEFLYLDGSQFLSLAETCFLRFQLPAPPFLKPERPPQPSKSGGCEFHHPQHRRQAQIQSAVRLPVLLVPQLRTSFLETSVWEWEACKCRCKVHFLLAFLWMHLGLATSRDWGSHSYSGLPVTLVRILCHPGVNGRCGSDF